jgi:Flp pilus assembly protein TadG
VRLTPCLHGRPPRLHGRHGQHEDEGAVAILVAILMVAVFLPLTALVVDLGYARDQRDQAQTAADASALAAAISYQADQDQTEARRQAKTYVDQNLPSLAKEFEDCLTRCVTFNDAEGTVTVALPATTPLGIFTGGVAVEARATAQWGQVHTSSCWLCVQSRSSTVGLDAQDGTVTLDVGNIRIGTSGLATASLSTGYVKTGASWRIGYTGTTPAGPSSHYSPAPTQVGTAAPAAGWPLFTFGTPVVAPAGKCSPGTYSDITQCTGFSSGFYVITGPNVFTGSAFLSTDANVFFYLTCSSNGRATPCAYASDPSGGTLTWSRNADFAVSGWSFFGWTIAIAVDPGNTAQQLMVSTDRHATGNFYVNGSVFAPNSTLALKASNISEDGHLQADSTSLFRVTGQITVDRLTLTGIGAQLHQQGTPPTDSPPTPVPVHLVQ